MKTLTRISLIILATTLTAGAANASRLSAHPRVNEINQRLANQNRRIEAGEAKGQITQRQEARDEHLDNRISRQLSRYEARHNGHITRAEQVRLNRELNRNSRRIYRQSHG